MADKQATAQQALMTEREFLSAVGANFEKAKGSHFRGSIWKTVHDDCGGTLRARMAERRNYDRDLLDKLPHNRRIVLHGYERAWWLGKKPTGTAIASVLTPLDHWASGDSQPAGPVDYATLDAHVREIAGDPTVPHVLGICSPSGFEPAAYEYRPESEKVTLVLAEPDERGGWKVTPVSEYVSDYVVRLFDPEDEADKLNRVVEEIQRSSADLLTGGIGADAVASRLGVSQDQVERAFELAAARDGELKVSKKSGQVLLYRGAASSRQERASMDVFERIKKMFSGGADETQKINMLAEQRAELARKRDRIYEDIAQLEQREVGLLEEGKQTSSQVARRRMAAQLAQLRKDIARQNTTANMLNQQINIISTDIHNLTLIRQGESAKLPATEDLTQNAVKAEEMLETLKGDADLVSGLETGMADMATSEEELAILREFEQAEAQPEKEAAPPSAAQTPAAEDVERETPAEPAERDRAAREAAPPERPADRQEKAGPEAS